METVCITSPFGIPGSIVGSDSLIWCWGAGQKLGRMSRSGCLYECVLACSAVSCTVPSNARFHLQLCSHLQQWSTFTCQKTTTSNHVALRAHVHAMTFMDGASSTETPLRAACGTHWKQSSSLWRIMCRGIACQMPVLAMGRREIRILVGNSIQ